MFLDSRLCYKARMGPRTLSPGDRIGEYVLEAPIGCGGFGEVWKARHAILTDKVAWSQDLSRHLIRMAYMVQRNPVFCDFFAKIQSAGK